MRRVALLAVIAVAAATSSVGTAAAPPPLILTEAESGSEPVVVRPRQVALRLDGRWRWTSPRTTGAAVSLTRVRYETNPGYVEWRVRLVGPGRATVTSAGEPNCRNCARLPRRFRVTIVVRT